ncbi:hypothetical protein AB0D66_30790 [Streptomyces sp. NPDC048270]|uniref:hypothetical protein n=1 Tax=Streptomyces sp. NPDC048270 TaxID=3154615 RepID=UPI003405D367
MANQDAHGDRIDYAPHNGKVHNIGFDAYTENDIHQVYGTVIDEVPSLQICGPHFDPVRLCESPEEESCAVGDHNCGGLLQRYAGYDLDIISCRGPASEAPLSYGYGHDRQEWQESTGVYIEPYKQMLIEEARGPTPFEGRFAAKFDEMPQAQQAYLLSSIPIERWVNARAAWTASNGYTDYNRLVAYLRSFKKSSRGKYKKLLKSELLFSSKVDLLQVFRAEQPGHGYECITADILNASDVGEGDPALTDEHFRTWAWLCTVWHKSRKFTNVAYLESELGRIADARLMEYVDFAMTDPRLLAALSDRMRLRLDMLNEHQSDPQRLNQVHLAANFESNAYVRNDLVLNEIITSVDVLRHDDSPNQPSARVDGNMITGTLTPSVDGALSAVDSKKLKAYNIERLKELSIGEAIDFAVYRRAGVRGQILALAGSSIDFGSHISVCEGTVRMVQKGTGHRVRASVKRFLAREPLAGRLRVEVQGESYPLVKDLLQKISDKEIAT